MDRKQLLGLLTHAEDAVAQQAQRILDIEKAIQTLQRQRREVGPATLLLAQEQEAQWFLIAKRDRLRHEAAEIGAGTDSSSQQNGPAPGIPFADRYRGRF
jgi:hypothetical protein